MYLANLFYFMYVFIFVIEFMFFKSDKSLYLMAMLKPSALGQRQVWTGNKHLICFDNLPPSRKKTY